MTVDRLSGDGFPEWEVEAAGMQLEQVVRLAAVQPQVIVDGGKIVAAVVSVREFREFDVRRHQPDRPSHL